MAKLTNDDAKAIADMCLGMGLDESDRDRLFATFADFGEYDLRAYVDLCRVINLLIQEDRNFSRSQGQTAHEFVRQVLAAPAAHPADQLETANRVVALTEMLVEKIEEIEEAHLGVDLGYHKPMKSRLADYMAARQKAQS